MAIGVFDSGLGGLTVLRALQAAAPNQSFVYFGDHANAPYGRRAPDEVFVLTRSAIERLFAADCQLVLLACNTASALALRRIQQEWLPALAEGGQRRVLGVFVPIVEVITGRRWADASPSPTAAPAGRRRVLFFATPATVASGAFEREVASRTAEVQVVSQACPGLVDALERGDAPAASAIVADAVAGALAVSEAVPQAAVLGCTHYPLAYDAFRAALPAQTSILSQPDIVAASLARYLERHPEFESVASEAHALRLLTSGDPAAVGALAATFWGAPAAFAKA